VCTYLNKHRHLSSVFATLFLEEAGVYSALADFPHHGGSCFAHQARKSWSPGTFKFFFLARWLNGQHTTFYGGCIEQSQVKNGFILTSILRFSCGITEVAVSSSVTDCVCKFPILRKFVAVFLRPFKHQYQRPPRHFPSSTLNVRMSIAT
jgi:hypothetical protein